MQHAEQEARPTLILMARLVVASWRMSPSSERSVACIQSDRLYRYSSKKMHDDDIGCIWSVLTR